MDSRPIRKQFDKAVKAAPRGPLGRVGEGNLAGAANYFAVSTAKGLIPIDGINAGFNVESHNIERSEGEETHTFLINASNEAVARFAASYLAAPSNIDYLLDKPTPQLAEVEVERPTFPTYRVVVENSVDGFQGLQKKVNGGDEQEGEEGDTTEQMI